VSHGLPSISGQGNLGSDTSPRFQQKDCTMDYIATNREAWNRRTRVHLTSAFYDVEGFLQGNSSLREIERAELGPVAGRSLLHLQCHFGLDTLSWAREGARVTGVDLSPVAIESANALAAQTGLAADFICADLYSFGDTSTAQFDIVFTSYGALCWLPDLERWAALVARSLKPGGTFYMAEFHPVQDLFAGYSYFHSPAPAIEQEGTYTENDSGETATLVTWAHPLSEVINALLGAGLQLCRLNEYPWSPYNCFENMVEREPGRFSIEHQGQAIPLVYTLTARKPD